jgi:hypothetical protein
MVQVALPEQSVENPVEYLTDAIYRAIDEVARWAQRRRVEVDLQALRGIVARAATLATSTERDGGSDH